MKPLRKPHPLILESLRHSLGPAPWPLNSAPARESRGRKQTAERAKSSPTVAEAVGRPAAERDEESKAEQVRSYGWIEVQRIGSQRLGDGGQSGRNDGPVQDLHEGSAGYNERNNRPARQGKRHTGPSDRRFLMLQQGG